MDPSHRRRARRPRRQGPGASARRPRATTRPRPSPSRTRARPVPDPNPDVRPVSAPTDGTTPKRRVSANLTLDGPSTAKRKRGRPPKPPRPRKPQSPSRPSIRRSSGRRDRPSRRRCSSAKRRPFRGCTPSRTPAVSSAARGWWTWTRRTDRGRMSLRGERLVGTAVEGIVDGAFDAGYLVTARVGNNLFRGRLWREDEPPR